MESPLLGLVLDSPRVVIAAERKKQTVGSFIEEISSIFGSIELSVSVVTLAELVRGIFRARNADGSRRRREYIDEIARIIPVCTLTAQTAWRRSRKRKCVAS
jgi:predicted nucleic acid-binding protein